MNEANETTDPEPEPEVPGAHYRPTPYQLAEGEPTIQGPLGLWPFPILNGLVDATPSTVGQASELASAGHMALGGPVPLTERAHRGVY